MLLKEVMEKSGLSRKAVQYYEDQGFVKPVKLENGYRDYDEDCLKTLRDIHSAMRRERRVDWLPVQGLSVDAPGTTRAPVCPSGLATNDAPDRSYWCQQTTTPAVNA